MGIRQYAKYLKEDTSLRPYQRNAKQEIYDSWEEVDDVMFQMPTGTGKTRLFTSIIKDINDISIAKKEPVKILIVAHRKELIDQIDESLKKYRVAHSKFVGNKDNRDITPPVLVTSIQTISHKKNVDERQYLKYKVKYIIIDEAHHAVAHTYSKLWHCFPQAKILGVTATPYRLSHEGFTKLFKKLILSPSVKQFIKDGWLAPYTYYSLKSTSYINTIIDSIDEFDPFGDYKESALESAMDKDKIRAQLLDSYLKFAKGKKGIIYSINRAHSEHICQNFAAAGLRVVSIDAKTPKAERETLVEKFKRGYIDILVNVNIFSEGFDCPDIEFIQLARPTKSLSMYLQQVGRGLRITQGKTNCIILDNVGMYSRFGLPDARRMWNKHFIGLDVVEETSKPAKHSMDDFFGQNRRPRDLSEGTEQMMLIQDVSGVVYDEEEVAVETDIEEGQTSADYLDSIGFNRHGLLWWRNGIEDTYEGYVQDKGNYIISKLEINTETEEVHRRRVARIAPTSWAFDRLIRDNVETLEIKHYIGSCSVLTWTFNDSKSGLDSVRYFDYLGKEVNSPQAVEKRLAYLQKYSKLEDKIDLPQNYYTYGYSHLGDKIALTKTINGLAKIICKVPKTSILGLFIDHISEFEVVKELTTHMEIKVYEDGVKIYRFSYDGHQINSLGKLLPDESTDIYKKYGVKNISNGRKDRYNSNGKPHTLEDRIIEVIINNDGIKAIDIASKLGEERSAVNRILYTSLKSKVWQDLLYKWHLKKGTMS